ncbi:hypothetical protein E4T66_18590 [Sinimarinibacterium sp. CAU 1509]|uniref:hypothetical protein n=1 Tax=Sinimarinibacterium sp. CAU 1509 TaxID=2562283 RepID=UPI0010ABCD02|nr:hypothetical protein [Sinimarinibacterium sp. CAU 1509]TJY57416.1 hypothetical protein E4T66_18590 [Sinimarinibacterium sp. CAU 1509]
MPAPEKLSAFVTSCVGCTTAASLEALEECIAIGRDIGYRTFARKVGAAAIAELHERLGYARCGLTLRNDPYVSFTLSTFGGVRCAVLIWSATEFVYVAPRDMDRVWPLLGADELAA